MGVVGVGVGCLEEWGGGEATNWELYLPGKVQEEGCEELLRTTKSSHDCDLTLLAVFSLFIAAIS